MPGFSYAIETAGLVTPTHAENRVAAVTVAHVLADEYNRPANIYTMPNHHLYGVVYPNDTKG